MEKLLLSVIVPTYNRAGEITELLSTLKTQKYMNFEVVVVDDGSTDNTKDIIDKFSQDGMNINYTYQQNKGPGMARNNAMGRAKGDIFIFVDSDCLLPDDWLLNIAKHFSEEEVDAFGGRDTFHPSFSPMLKAIDYSMTSFIGTGGARSPKKGSVVKYYPRSFNMGIRRKIYETIGGMNDLRHGQDMDYSNRIYKAGFKVKYFDDVYVYHKRRTDLRRFFKQVFNWGTTRINLGRLDKNMMKPAHYLPAFAVLGYLFLLIGAFLSTGLLYTFGVINFIGLLIFCMVFVQSTRKYKSVKVGLLSIVTLCSQVLAYGLGFITGKLKGMMNKDKEIKGFTKKYYD